MKRLVTKYLLVCICFISLGLSTRAQIRDVEHELTSFSAVDISGAFQASLTYDKGYAAKITIDDALEPYVVCYVKGKTLFIGLDEKAIPKETKKQFKGRNSTSPTYRVVIYAPEITSVTLADEASFSFPRTVEVDDFTLSLSGAAQVQGLSVISKSAHIEAVKKSNLIMNVKCDVLDFSTDGNAKTRVDYTASSVQFNCAGSSDAVLNGECGGTFAVNAAGSAKAQVSGKADVLQVGGKGNAKINASALPVKEARLSIAGISVSVQADDVLELDLSKGAEVTYSRDPKIKIVSIQNASVTRE